MPQPQQLELDRKKILSQVERLAELAEKNDWKYEYDSELDQLIYGKDYMPRDSFLFNVNDEINLFLSPDSSVNGIYIEYFKANFLEHNKELKPVLDAIENKTINPEAETALEIELSADAFKSLFAKERLVTAL